MDNIILSRDFYERSTLCVARELLGKILKFFKNYGVITEVEAYIGKDDSACHAAKGYTVRTSVMFGLSGYSYVYFIYGMYHCLNIVTETEGFPAAVLIRSLYLYNPVNFSVCGPGKLCNILNITRKNNSFDLTQDHSFCVYDSDISPGYVTLPRIGIKTATDKLWRFKII